MVQHTRYQDAGVPGRGAHWRRTSLLVCLTLLSISSLWITGVSLLDYRSTYALDCGTGRLGALGTLYLAPILLSLPLALWWGLPKNHPTRTFAQRVAFWPALIWLLTAISTLLMESLR